MRELQKRQGKRALEQNVKRISPKAAAKNTGPKRPRGRPPKKPVDSSELEPKRPRGRPRKDQIPTETLTTPKKSSKRSTNNSLSTASSLDDLDLDTQKQPNTTPVKRKALDDDDDAVPRKQGRSSVGKGRDTVDTRGIISESEWSRITGSNVASEGRGKNEKLLENHEDSEKDSESYREMEKNNDSDTEIEKGNENSGEVEKNRENVDAEARVGLLEFDAVSQASEESLDSTAMSAEQKFDLMMRKEESKSPKKSVVISKFRISVPKNKTGEIGSGGQNEEDASPKEVLDNKTVGSRESHAQAEGENVCIDSNTRNSLSAEQKFDAMMRKDESQSPKKSKNVSKDKGKMNESGTNRPARSNIRVHLKKISKGKSSKNEVSVEDTDNVGQRLSNRQNIVPELKTAEEKFDAMMRNEESKSPKKSEPVPKVRLAISKEGGWKFSDKGNDGKDSGTDNVWDELADEGPNKRAKNKDVEKGEKRAGHQTRKEIETQEESGEIASSGSDIFDDWDRIRALKPPERKFISTSPK